MGRVKIWDLENLPYFDFVAAGGILFHKHASYLKASPFDETDLVLLVEMTEARYFLGEGDSVLDGLVQQALESVPTDLPGLTYPTVRTL